MKVFWIKPKKIITLILVLLMLIVGVKFAVNYVVNYIEKAMYPIDHLEYIKEYSEEFDLDPWLVVSVIWVESKFDSDARSSKDARGLMQVTPQTGAWAAEKLELEGYDDDMLYQPKTNINIGCWYLDNLRSEFDGNLDLVIAAYNGGSGNVTDWLKDNRYSDDGKSLKEIPFEETKNYVEKVFTTRDKYKEIYQDDENIDLN